jgi:outer membrane protein insertion porin family
MLSGNMLRLVARAGLVVLLLSATAVAQQPTRKSVKLLGVTVVGNKTADANLIKLNSGLTPGTEITAEDIQRAIKQLWKLDMFSDIQILLDKELATGVFLTIKVEEYPRLDKIELAGNKKIKKKDLEEKLEFYRGQVISPRDVQKAEQKLKKLYEEKGYLLAEIDPEVRPSEVEGRVILRLNIKEGNKVQIKKIRFHGNEAFSDKKLRKQMKDTKQDGFFGGGDFDPKKYREDLDKVLAFYRKNGFRDAEVVRDTISYDAEKKHMFIDIWVREGTRYYVGQITWEGNTLYTDEQLTSVLGFKTGDVYNQEALQEAVTERLGSLYYDAGYIFANINPREQPVSADTVNIHFVISEGNAVKVNKIHITGNTKTKEKVIRRELRLHPGETFSREALVRSQRDVWVLNYFSDVQVDVQPIDEERVDVSIQVEEKSTDTANMSAGYSERDKLIGSLGLAMNNLFGNGQRLSIDWNFGRSFRSFQISFTEPWLLDTPTLAGFSFYDIKRSARFIGYSQRSQGGSLRIGRRFRWPDNFFRGDWIYSIDRTELGDFDPVYEGSYLTEIKWPQISSSITQIISRNSLNRPEFPTAGSEVSLSNQVAGGILGGNVDFHKHVFRAKWFSPLVKSLVIYNNVQAGYMEGFTKSSNIPPLELFYMGGEGLTQSIPLRGYVDPLSTRRILDGGKVMLKYTTELRVPISPNPTIFALAFAEAGNTWPDLKRTDPFDLRRSVGVGIRVFMPMLGILGFDYAYGFDNIDPQTGLKQGRWRPHFVFGRSF